jgi:hypothetical protein
MTPASPSVVVGEIDFSTILLAHDAFTRDLRRVTEALLLGRAWTRPAETTWSTLARQLRHHLRAEDEVLWPLLRASVRPYPEAIDEIATEREHIETVITAVETAYRAERVIEFYDVVNHLGRRVGAYEFHHEQLALPLIASRIPQPGWTTFTARLRQLQGRGGAAEYLPWLLDGSTGATSEAVLAGLPARVRLLHHLRWTPRYRRSHLSDQRP